MMTTYKLSTLRDVFEKVPPEKMRLCLREMADAMEQAHALRDLILGSAEELGENDGVFWPDECEWIDDGKEDKTIAIVSGSTDKVEFTYTSSKAPSSVTPATPTTDQATKTARHRMWPGCTSPRYWAACGPRSPRQSHSDSPARPEGCGLSV